MIPRQPDRLQTIPAVLLHFNRSAFPFAVTMAVILGLSAELSWSQTAPIQPDHPIQPATPAPPDLFDLIQPSPSLGTPDESDPPARPDPDPTGESTDQPDPITPLPRTDVRLERQQGAYTLGAGDEISIDVFSFAEFSGQQTVLLDGSIAMPLIGTVRVQGLTLEQVSEELEFQFSAYLDNPSITVRLITARPLQIAVVGEVQRPGSYSIAARGQTGVPRVSQLIQEAGGITGLADIRRVQLRRPDPIRPNQEQRFTVNLWMLLQTGDLQLDLPVLDGDQIYVPTAVAINPEEAQAIATANFAPDTITISVVGEVVRPGQFTLPPNAPLNQAILTAGGFNRRAESAAVQLIRLNPNGSVDQRLIPVDFRQGINESFNPILQDTDIIVVSPTGIAEASDSLAVLLSPFGELNSVLNLIRVLSD